jgi:hypothetical protein
MYGTNTDRASRALWRLRLAANDSETVVEDDDVEGHRLATNDNETVVDGMRRIAPGGDESDTDPEIPGLARGRR